MILDNRSVSRYQEKTLSISTPILPMVSTLTTPRSEAVIDPKPIPIYAKITPDELMDFYQERMEVEATRLLEPYIGKWITFKGAVGDVSIEDRPYVPLSHRIKVIIKLPGFRVVLLF